MKSCRESSVELSLSANQNFPPEKYWIPYLTHASMLNLKKLWHIAKISYIISKIEERAEETSDVISTCSAECFVIFLNLYRNEDLPIMQALVFLKEPGVKRISSGTENYVFGEEVLKHRYKVIKLYEMDKYDILKSNVKALFPMRVFMKHKDEPPIEHLKECLDIAETIGDPDFYFMPVECGTKLYGREIVVTTGFLFRQSTNLRPYCFWFFISSPTL